MTEDKRERADWKQANGTKQKKEKKKRKKKTKPGRKGKPKQNIGGRSGDRGDYIRYIHTGGQTGPRWRALLGKSGPKILVFSKLFAPFRFIKARDISLCYSGERNIRPSNPSHSVLETRVEGRAGKMRRGMNFKINFSQRINSSSIENSNSNFYKIVFFVH